MSTTPVTPTPPAPLPSNPADIQTPATQQAEQTITQQAQDARSTPIPQPNQAEMVSQPAWGAKQQQGMGIADQNAPLVPKGVSPNDPNAYNPSVQRAGVWHTVATALTGGQRYKTTYDANGVATRTPIPVSGKALGLALAMELLGGAARGAGAGVNPGKAAQAGAEYGQQLQQQRRADQQAMNTQAQNDYQSQQNALVRKASVFEANMRGLLNAAEVEKYGADGIDRLTELNRQSGLLDPSPDYIENGGIPMTQDELLAAQQSGKINATDYLGPISGRVEKTGSDGLKYWEPTHLILKSGDVKVPLTQEDWDRYAAHGVKGYPVGRQIGLNVTVPLWMKANSNEQLNAHVLSEYRLNDLRTVLADTPFADQVPKTIDFTAPGIDSALQAYQKYISHDAENAEDPYLALKAMGADKRDPKSGAMMQNPDSRFVDSAARALGGWPLLEAAHDQILANKAKSSEFSIIDTPNKAMAVVSSPDHFTPKQVSQAKTYISLAQQLGIDKAAAEIHIRMDAENAPTNSVPTDALGFTPNVPGGLREYNKRQDSFKKNADDLSKTEGTYQQFQNILKDINAGKDMTGAQSVVGLFDAIGISATPLKGAGFRVNSNVIKEHEQARGWVGALQQRLLNVKAGDVITPQQLKDYANLASQARQSQYINLVNEAHNQGLSADFILPNGNGQKLDPSTAQIFLTLSGGDANKARAAAQQKGWKF